MIKTRMHIVALVCLAALSACNFPAQQATATPTRAAPQTTATGSMASAMPSPSATPGQEGPVEAIQILAPGPGSRLVSPLTVTGVADPTFEQNLVVRLLLADGRLLATQPTTIAAPLGQRGPFQAELPFSVQEPGGALLQVLSTSARDGGLTHLASVGVTLAPNGPAQIKPVQPGPEQLQIWAPLPNAEVCSRPVQVEGFGLASFEGTLVVEIQDVQGQVIASQPLTVAALEMGQPGPFSATLSCAVEQAQVGRIVVRDPLPAFDGLGHLNSIPVTLLP